MKKFLVLTLALVSSSYIFAGNPDRAGEAGAYELTLNTWARSSGFMGMNSANVMGLEAMRSNVGGLTQIRGTQIAGSHSFWWAGSNINITTGGFAQKLGEDNVIGVSIQSVNFGELQRTTYDLPEGDGSTFSPNFMNIGISYARSFSSSIHGGVTVRLINESIPDANATGAAIDAGLQYVTGDMENIHFGVSIRNIGVPMTFRGDGFTFRGDAPDGQGYQMTQLQRSDRFELPSQLNIGLGYDLLLGSLLEDNPNDAKSVHRVSFVGQFTSNSFGKDHFGGGIEYAMREQFMLRAGYRYEDGLLSSNDRTSLNTGLAGGFTVMFPVSKKEDAPNLALDYSYQTTRPYNGTHTVGLLFNL